MAKLTAIPAKCNFFLHYLLSLDILSTGELELNASGASSEKL
jgi:hypothetical protein